MTDVSTSLPNSVACQINSRFRLMEGLTTQISESVDQLNDVNKQLASYENQVSGLIDKRDTLTCVIRSNTAYIQEAKAKLKTLTGQEKLLSTPKIKGEIKNWEGRSSELQESLDCINLALSQIRDARANKVVLEGELNCLVQRLVRSIDRYNELKMSVEARYGHQLPNVGLSDHIQVTKDGNLEVIECKFPTLPVAQESDGLEQE